LSADWQSRVDNRDGQALEVAGIKGEQPRYAVTYHGGHETDER
jgi:hypothetical protein